MKKVTLIAILALFIMGCKGIDQRPTADEIDQSKQEQLTKEAQAQTGMPAIVNFQEKKMIKMLYELRDNPQLVNYAYLWSEVTGKWVYLGKCMGYGMPYATQFSNPSKIAVNVGDFGEYAHDAIMPQAEPNGLFMPNSAEGTWLMLINPNNPNEIKPIYVEPRCIVSPFKLPVQ